MKRSLFTQGFFVYKLDEVIFLKLINNSSSLNKGNHDRDGVWISDLISIDFYDFISPFSP